MLVTMNSKWQGSRFITSQAPGTTTTTPRHHSNLFLPHHNKQHQQTTIYSSLTSSHCLSIAPTTTPTSYLNGKVPHLFFFVFFFTNHLEHQVHSHHPSPSSLSIPPVNTQPYILETCLRLEPKIFFFYVSSEYGPTSLI